LTDPAKNDPDPRQTAIPQNDSARDVTDYVRTKMRRNQKTKPKTFSRVITKAVAQARARARSAPVRVRKLSHPCEMSSRWAANSGTQSTNVLPFQNMGGGYARHRNLGRAARSFSARKHSRCAR